MTTNILVPTFLGNLAEKQQILVNAHDLHKFLEVGKHFASWIQGRIDKYEFIKNEDFRAISQNREIGHGRGRVEYHISLDMAKELAMVENNTKGRQARRYFIAMEQQVIHQQSALVELNSKLKDRLMVDHLRYRQMYRYLSKGLNQDEIARCMQISTRAVRMIKAEMRELELLPEQEIFVMAHTGKIARTVTPTQLGLLEA